MSGKHPQTILTDQSAAMASTITEVFPNTILSSSSKTPNPNPNPNSSIYLSSKNPYMLNRKRKNPSEMASEYSIPEESIQNPSLFQFQESIKNKTLYICFSGENKGYAIRSLPGNTVINPYHQTPQPPLKEVWSYIDNAALTIEGCGISGSNVYFVGGVVPYHYRMHGDNPDSLRDSSKYVVCYNTSDGSTSFVPNMILKPDPIVFTKVGESEESYLYVLSSPYYKYVTNPAFQFEVCNLSTKSWEQLPPPPFCAKFQDEIKFDRIGYAVIGNYFCVSTSQASFQFDIKNNIWEPCMLFQNISTQLTGLKYSRRPDPCGPPFPFFGRAVLFDEDTLICMHSRRPYCSVVAYKMVDRKIVRSQSFNAQGLTVTRFMFTAGIAHFGHGFFGIAFVEEFVDDVNYVLSVKLFHLINKKEEDEEEFLLCKIVNEFKYAYNAYEDSQYWHPIGCFVH